MGTRQYGGVRQYIPLKINAAGVMPIIFAQALMFILNFRADQSWLANQFIIISNAERLYQPLGYNLIYGFLIVIFTYFSIQPSSSILHRSLMTWRKTVVSFRYQTPERKPQSSLIMFYPELLSPDPSSGIGGYFAAAYPDVWCWPFICKVLWWNLIADHGGCNSRYLTANWKSPVNASLRRIDEIGPH